MEKKSLFFLTIFLFTHFPIKSMRKQRAETLFGVAALLFAAKMEYKKRVCKRKIEEYVEQCFQEKQPHNRFDSKYAQEKRKLWSDREKCLQNSLLTVMKQEE